MGLKALGWLGGVRRLQGVYTEARAAVAPPRYNELVL